MELTIKIKSMTKTILIGFILMTVQISLIAQNEEKAVLDCFNAFKKSYSEENGLEVYKLIDVKSSLYLSELLTNAQFADSVSVSKLDAFDKLFLFYSRSMLERVVLREMHEDQFLDFLIKSKLYGSYDFIKTGKIWIDGNQAKIEISDTDPICYLYFNKESNIWKYYINSVFDVERVKLQSMLKENNLDETDFIISRIEKMTGKPFNPQNWKSLKKK
jgi:hypothetical protein